MPELPEVETIRFDLDRYLSGYTITDLWNDTPKMMRPSYEEVRDLIIGLQIKGFRRRGKNLIVEFTKGKISLLIHLKMTGRMLIREKKDPEDRWTHVVFSLKKGEEEKELRFANQRKFGYVRAVNTQELEEIISKLGPEPLDDLTYEVFEKTLLSKKIAIKKILLDQSLFAGIGNIYANDALFLAKIHPETIAKDISKKKMRVLFKSVEEVLKKGLAYRGASDDSYLDAFGIKGKYQEHFLIYRKDKTFCPRCNTKIKRIKVGGRGTFYCPSCQKK